MAEFILAVPSKGRLEEQARAVFADAGMAIERPGGARSYQGEITGNNQVVVRFLSAGEIARELTRGNIHAGVTGADLIHEVSEQGPDQVVFAKPLGFGQADVVIAVPDSWIDCTHMADLSDIGADFGAHKTRWLRIATKYINLTRGFFKAHGIAEYRIVESLGATEAAPAAGSAELIVDITSTGSTLRANGLRILEDGVILKSQANLIVSKSAAWTDQTRSTFTDILSKLDVDNPEAILS